MDLHTLIRMMMAAALLLGATVARSQDADRPDSDPPAANAPALTVERVEQLREQAQSAEALDEETLERVDRLWAQVIQHLERTDELGKRGAAFGTRATTAKERAAKLKAAIETLQTTEPDPIDNSAELSELEQQLGALNQQVEQLKLQSSESEGAIADRTARRQVIRDRLVEADQQREALQAQQEQPVADGEPPAAAQAQQAEITSRIEMLGIEITALGQEVAALDAEDAVSLPQLQRDEISLRLANQESRLAPLQELVQQLRADEANRKIVDAQMEALYETDPRLSTLAEDNVKLARQYQTLTDLISREEQNLADRKQLRSHWTQQYESARDKVNAIGLTNAVGTLLRDQKRSLPDPRTYRRNIRRRGTTISDAQFRQLDLEEQRSKAVAEVLSETAPQGERDLVAKRNELLTSLARAQGVYFKTLVDLSNTEAQLVNETIEYARFIDERILWVRSGLPLWETFPIEREDVWFLDSSRWSRAVDSMMADVRSNPLWYLLAGVGLLLLVANGRLLRKRITTLGEEVESYRSADFAPTVRATSLTILAAMPWPALFAFLGWRLMYAGFDDSLTKSVALACSTVALVYFPLEFLRVVCRPHGLAESHFGWPKPSLVLLRSSIRWIMLLGLPLLFVMTMLNENLVRPDRDGLERIMFITVTLAWAVFVSRVLHPRAGIFGPYLSKNPDGWAAHLKVFWYGAMLAAPLLLVALATLGYAYTAQQLAWRLYATVVLIAAAFIITGFVTRMLLVQRRRIGLEQMKRRQQADRSESDPLAAIEMPSTEDLRAQIAQSRRLLYTVMFGIGIVGLWIAWADVSPAVRFLDGWSFWDSTKTVSVDSTDELGNTIRTSHEILDPVTIADMGFAILVATITILAARNVPGVLEISILQRLPIEDSFRYAVRTVASYLIVLVGLIITCNAIGIHWKQVQWMAAALTFGLAFGLQEMFANFVAGIIILFERPVRVGDVVTIDGVTGIVSRVRIRATTITNWDRKDYLVPNKDFITGRVLNWTLSNQFNRIVIKLGVAYGSDKDETVRQLLRVAAQHPNIVDDPGPSVTFEEFGDSSLNYVLRCYISTVDMPSRLRITHELNTAIDDAFRQAGIEIPFPQQDLHLRTAGPQTTLFRVPDSSATSPSPTTWGAPSDVRGLPSSPLNPMDPTG